MQEFRTYDEQLDILEQDRELTIGDREETKKILQKENYYNIINGYKDLFLRDDCSNEKYLPGATFNEIYSLYEFDREIRNIIFGSILKVENTLRTQIAYVFSEKYGVENYLIFGNFETFIGSPIPAKRVRKQAYKIHTLISRLQSDIANSIERKDYIKHYAIDHGYIPLWVLVNVMTLGRLGNFYSLMKQSERIQVAKYWNIAETDLAIYMIMLATYRNICAHDDRLYNSNSGKYSITDNQYHSFLGILRVNGRYICGKNDLFSAILILKILLPQNEFTNCFNKLNGRIESLKNKLGSISIDDVLNKMGFPTNWKDIK